MHERGRTLARLSRLLAPWQRLGWLLMLLLLGTGTASAYEPDIAQMNVQRSTEALYLSARLKLVPGPAVEDALLKGVPLYFVWTADVYRYRWYWSDKRVTSATRTLRLTYQPLTRRWRLSLSHENTGNAGTGLQYALHYNFDSLDEAMDNIGRLARWKIADANRLDLQDRHRVEWSFRLDLTLLPRPFQIGMANQPEWVIGVQRLLLVPDQAEPERRGEHGAESAGPDAPHEPSGMGSDAER
jgi:hypothetical protein